MPRKKSPTIGLHTILRKIQSMRSALENRLDKIEYCIEGLDIRIGGVERRTIKIDGRLDGIESRVGNVEVQITRGFDLLSMQIGNIDGRLDSIEVKELPRIKAKIGMR